MIKIEELIKWCGEVRYILTDALRCNEPLLKFQATILLKQLEECYPEDADKRYQELMLNRPAAIISSILADPEE